MDWFELIPIIAIALYYIFRPGKKPEDQEGHTGRERRQDPMEPEREHRTLEDILREVMEGPSRPKPVQPIPEPEPEPEIESDYSSPYDSFTGVLDETEDAERETRSKKKLWENPGIQESPEPVDFDLRQAVINDAILNRPWT